VDDAIAALKKIQANAAELVAAKQALMAQMDD
jgi:hypothetical protein